MQIFFPLISPLYSFLSAANERLCVCVTIMMIQEARVNKLVKANILGVFALVFAAHISRGNTSNEGCCTCHDHRVSLTISLYITTTDSGDSSRDESEIYCTQIIYCTSQTFTSPRSLQRFS